MKYSQYLKLAISFLALSGSMVSVVFLQRNSLKQFEAIQDQDTYIKEQEQFSTIAKIQKQLPSFGYNNLLADWSFLQFVGYFGDGRARQITGYSTVTDYFEDIVNRDPHFMQSNLVMSSANSLFAGRPQKTVDLLNKALETVTPETPHYPFLLWTYKATDETLFLGDLEAARNSYEIAAQWASLRQDEIGEEMSRRYQNKVEFLASNPDPTQAQFGAWMSALSATQDRKTQDYILNKLKELGTEITISPDGRLDIKPPKLDRA